MRAVGKSTERRFFVYVHRRNDDGSIFYVGKGHGRRHRNISTRNAWWKRIAAKHGFTAETPFTNLTEQCAFSIEKMLIAAYRAAGHILVNSTDGGEGPTGRVFSEETRAKMSAAKKGKAPSGSQLEAMRAANLGAKRSDETRAKQSAARKAFYADKPKKVRPGKARGERNANYNDTIYHFVHREHGARMCTQNELRFSFPINHSNLSAMVNGRIKSTLGWTIHKECVS